MSINRLGEPVGVRTEIKNIGSVRAVAGAVKYEIQRQVKLKECGGAVVNETRAWDAVKKRTIAMRDKEVVQVKLSTVEKYGIVSMLNVMLRCSSYIFTF